MPRIALHTRLKPGREDDYDRIHAVIPQEFDAALRAAGVASWQIWRDDMAARPNVVCKLSGLVTEPRPCLRISTKTNARKF